MTPDEVFKKLLNIYHENRLAHAYLLETNNIDSALKDLNNFLKMILCPNEYTDNCLKCNICRLIDTNSLPSLIYIYPEGKTIKKDSIELIKNEFSHKPVYTNYNVYVIVQPELMNDTSYNKMLKFIEEPEENIIGFFITSHKDKVADTIISRLEVIKLLYSNADINFESLDSESMNKVNQIVDEYIKKINLGINEIICYNTNVIQKELTEKLEIIYLFQRLLAIFRDKLHQNYDIKYLNTCDLLIKYLERLNYNVNIPLLMDSFAIEMEQIYEE